MHEAGFVRWEGSGEKMLPVEVYDASTSGLSMRMVGLPQEPGSRMVVKGDEVVFRPSFPHAPHLEREVRALVRAVFNETGNGIGIGLQYLPEQPMIVREAVAQLLFGSSENCWRSGNAAADTRGFWPGCSMCCGLR